MDIKKVKCPVHTLEFRKYWNILLPKIIERENFHQSHLKSLEILCSLYVEFDELSRKIKTEGYTFSSEGRYGLNVRTHPLVEIRKNVMTEIRQFSRLLGLVLNKDISTKENPAVEEEWS